MVEIDSSALYDLKEFRDLLGLENWYEFWKKETLHLKRGGVDCFVTDRFKGAIESEHLSKDLKGIKKNQ